MDPSGKPILSTGYVPHKTLSQFYAGGPIVPSSDGVHLLCANGEEVCVVDSRTSRVVMNVVGDSEVVTAIACSPANPNIIALASRSLHVRVYDISGKKAVQLRTFKAHDAVVLAMNFAPHGTMLATAGADQRLRVWDVAGGFCTHNFQGHRGFVTACSWHPDPSVLHVFSGSENGSVHCWDLMTSQLNGEIMRAHNSVVVGIAFAADADLMVCVGRDRIISSWTLSTQTLRRTVPANETLEAVIAIQGAGGVPMAATAGESGVLRLWNLETGFPMEEEAAAATENPGYSHAFLLAPSPYLSAEAREAAPSPSGAPEMVAVNHQQNIYFFSRTPKIARTRTLIGYNDQVTAAARCGEDWTQVAIATNNHDVRIVDGNNLGVRVFEGHTDVVLAVGSCRSNGRLLASTSKDSTARVWDVESGRCIAVAKGHTSGVSAVAWSQKTTSWLYTAGTDMTLKRWDMRKICKEGLAAARAAGVAATGDAAWDKRLPDLTCRSTIGHEKDVNSIAVAPNDAMIATGSQDRTIKLWESKTLRPMGTLSGHKRAVWSVAFSPVDRVLASASADQTIRIWSLKDQSCIRVLQGHTSSVLGVCWLPMGLQLVSGGGDGTVRLWTLRTGENVQTLDEHEGKVWALAGPPPLKVPSLDDPNGDSDDDEAMVEEEMLTRAQRNLALSVVTGGSDSKLVVWKDNTKQVAAEKAADQEKTLELEQALRNAMHSADFPAALTIALRLKHPFRTLGVCEKVISVDLAAADDVLASTVDEGNNEIVAGGAAPTPTLDKVISAAASGGDPLKTLMDMVVDWNTNTRNTLVAQCVLGSVLRCVSVETLMRIPGIQGIVDSLTPYSARHMRRASTLLQESYILDHAVAIMRTGVDADDDAAQYVVPTIVEEDEDVEMDGSDAEMKGLEMMEPEFEAVELSDEDIADVDELAIPDAHVDRRIR